MSLGSSTDIYTAFSHFGSELKPRKKPLPGNLPRLGIEPGPPGFTARRASRYSTGVDSPIVNPSSRVKGTAWIENGYRLLSTVVVASWCGDVFLESGVDPLVQIEGNTAAVYNAELETEIYQTGERSPLREKKRKLETRATEDDGNDSICCYRACGGPPKLIFSRPASMDMSSCGSWWPAAKPTPLPTGEKAYTSDRIADIYGHHAFSCARSKGRIPRHTSLSDIIKRSLISCGIPSLLEPPGVSRADGKRPYGLTLIRWSRGKSLFWDSTCVDTLAPSHLPNTSRRAASAVELALKKKVNKYAHLLDNYIFVLFAVETFGPWSHDVKNKKRGYLKEKLNEVETNSKNKNIRDLYKGIKEFKNGYQPRVNVIKDENGDLLADSPLILNRWKNYLAQLLNIHRPNRNDRDEIEMQTFEPFIPEPTFSEVEIPIENLKKYKSPGIDQVSAELIQEAGSALYSEIYKLVFAIWEKEIVSEQWKESIIVPIFKKGDKTNCGNFRGISLLLTSYKILSNILLRRLTPTIYSKRPREEIKRRINMGNACYYSVEKLLSSSLLSKNLKVRIYKTVILPVVLYGCETWTITLREEHRLKVFENKVLRKIFGAKRNEVTGEWRKLHNAELHALYSSPDISRKIKSRRLRWVGHVARMGESEMHIEC
ncbi:hypothetical protein ANN_09942 [Periplaneta americana]|uniref:Reverse transcriptase domain-containing protein n=1 Tax=Periplaneta americana TaxID=6978 RepID=A0ABQ8TQ02_PERAM|nr:hypothetical protein ANN_09942 [Periplaneta americana]